MRLDSGEERGTPGIKGIIGTAFVAYGAVGVAVNLRLLPLLVSGLVSWFGLPVASNIPARWAVLTFLEAHFDSLPWLPWAVWLLGFALLTTRKRPTLMLIMPEQRDPQTRVTGANWLVAILAILLIFVGAYTRMAQLWPQSKGISQFPYDDEGVYAGTSQLFLQGIFPYRDYFFAHPPIAALSYAPAMAYHFTAWGSPTSFMMARYLSVGYSLLTLVLLFLIGRHLAGLWGASIAAGLWALDGRVIEINRKIMLDGPMVLLSCSALLLYIWVRPLLTGDASASRPKRTVFVLLFAGVLAGMSALTKIAGVACLCAIVADLLWLRIETRRTHGGGVPFRLQLGGLFAGVGLALLVFLVPFLIAAPSQFVREVLFFQMLRPGDGLIDVPARIADLTATFGNALTPLFAALGFIVISLSLNRNTGHQTLPASPSHSLNTAWRTVALWTFFSLLLFTYSRSFYSHYYIQLAAPLCLLGAGVGILPGMLRRQVNNASGEKARGFDYLTPRLLKWVIVVPILLILVVALPLILVQWNGAHSRHEDRIFEVVARYVNNAVPPDTQVLTTDEQFNFLAARPPSRNASGYLIDSYGHMIFLGLGLDKRDWGDLAGAALRGEHSNDVYSVMTLPAAQRDFLDRATNSQLIVLHQKGLPRLTDGTIATIESQNKVAERQARYTIYRTNPPGASK